MSRTTIGRIYWKELRAQSGFLLALLVVGFLFQLVPSILQWLKSAKGFQFLPGAEIMIAFTISCCFAVGSTAILFAGEKESKTFGLLQRIPVCWGDLLVGKLLLTLCGSLVLILLLLPSGWLLALGRGSSDTSIMLEMPRTGGDLIWTVTVPLFFFAVVLLCSLLLEDVLKAALVGSAVAFIILALGHPTVRGRHWLPYSAFVVILAIDLGLARKWPLGNSGTWLDEPVVMPRWRRLRVRRKRSFSAEPAGSTSRLRRDLASHAWKEFRAVRSLAVALLVVAIACVFLGSQGGQIAYFGNILVAPWLLGTAAFRADQANGAYRLLTHNGVSPAGYWCVKHLVWLGMSIILTMLVFYGQIEWPPSMRVHSVYVTFGDKMLFVLESTTRLSGLIVLVYSIAQLCSLLIPGAISAAAISLFVSIALVNTFSYSVIRSAAPFSLWPAAFFAASWLRVGDWMAGRNTARAWCKVVAPLGIILYVTVAERLVFREGPLPSFTSNTRVIRVDRADRRQGTAIRPRLHR
jgi:hypothetical protein